MTRQRCAARSWNGWRFRRPPEAGDGVRQRRSDQEPGGGGLGASIVPSLSLGRGHVSAGNVRVVPLNPRARRSVGLVRLRGKRGTEGVKMVADALMTATRHQGRKRRRNGRYSFSARNRISRGARKPEKLSGSSIGSLPK